MRDGLVETKLGQYIHINTGKLDVNAASEFGKYPFFTCSRETYRIDEAAFEGESVLVAGNGDLNVKYYDGKFNAYQRTYVLNSIDRSILDNQFLFLYMQTYIEYLRSETRGTVIQYLKKGQFTDAKIKLPPLPEQKRIVDLISSVDSYIETLQQQLESAKRSRNAVLHELLTAGGDDWEYKTLSDICEVRDGTHDSPKPSHEGFALVTSKNIKDGKLDLQSAYLISPHDYVEVNKRSKVEQFNLLISMIGTIGEVIVIEEEPNFAIKNVGLLKSTEPILSRYLCHYLESQLGKYAISLSVSGSTQKFISLGKLRVLPVLYPPRQNQKAIVEAMSLFDQQISKNLEVAARIKNLRSSLLSDLLSGEHEIPASYDIVMGAA